MSDVRERLSDILDELAAMREGIQTGPLRHPRIPGETEPVVVSTEPLLVMPPPMNTAEALREAAMLRIWVGNLADMLERLALIVKDLVPARLADHTR